jgi:pimeloyl-ACP methyl ester carboxylesterase
MSTPIARSPLAYDDRGAGTPVVLLHGLTFDRAAWAPIVGDLGEEVRTVAIDLPGHGETGGPPCSLWEAAARVNATVTGLGIERPIVVGHSMSAAIAGIYAASYPALGLVNIDQPFEIRPFARMVRSLWPALSGPGFAAAFEPFRQSIGIDRIPQPLRSEVQRNQHIRQDVVLGYWDELAQTDPEDMQARIDETTGRIVCPSLIVFGRTLEPGERLKLLGRISRIEIEEWTGSGHCVHLVEAERFASRLRAFIDACASDEARPPTRRVSASARDPLSA